MQRLTLVLVSLLLTLSRVIAAEAPDEAAGRAAVQALESKLQFKEGTVSIADGMAKISLPPEFRYLSPKDTETVLVKLWGNPSGDGTLGMIVPAGISLADDASWAVVLTYTGDGHVKDADADKINYTKLLKEMQEATRESNAEREKMGHGAIELVGWATPPRYDKTARKMYWAKELRFAGAPENTLNYNIRVLGRQGVLVLNAIASMKQFPAIEKQAPQIVSMVEFQEGHRYADFNNKTDKVASYGLAALVAGGVAAKAGFFKVLWLGILAFKKFIIIGIIAVAAIVRKVMSRKATQGA